jgi:toxin ParE1/3/4
VTAKAVVPRALAHRDVEDAIDYYVHEAGANIAMGFVDDLQDAYDLIASHPASGSLRYAYELGLPDLRTLRLKRYPFLIFYLEQADHLDVWRVLHAKRDIPAWLRDSDT